MDLGVSSSERRLQPHTAPYRQYKCNCPGWPVFPSCVSTIAHSPTVQIAGSVK